MQRAKQRSRSNATGRLYELASRYVEQSALGEPDHDVAATVAPPCAPDLAGGEKDRSARLRQVLCYLATRLATSDHQHCSRVESGCTAVIGGIDLAQAARQRCGPDRA